MLQKTFYFILWVVTLGAALYFAVEMIKASTIYQIEIHDGGNYEQT